ncbi:hypothetical protein MTR_1g112090 [Medicago truncatula]|uniref:Uncharacterized protein n=1 Tax=Medicago truncatula TaxID=3880 RepID=A0A072VRL3_MEDTR|nr:hypothetical protein MTR_1g112090 [Medicago truncatula]
MSDMKYRCRQQHPFLESKNVHHCVCDVIHNDGPVDDDDDYGGGEWCYEGGSRSI